MSGPVRIRPERPSDVDAIRAVTAAAFAGVPHSATSGTFRYAAPFDSL